MLGRVKKFLGIEGVKLELVLPEEMEPMNDFIQGKIRFYSMNPQTVTFLKVVLIERYVRGRGKEKLTDEYELGSIERALVLDIPANEPVEVDFKLPFSKVKSDVDEFADKNLLFRGIAGLARRLHNVKSEFRLEAEARVKGTALNPFDRKVLPI